MTGHPPLPHESRRTAQAPLTTPTTRLSLDDLDALAAVSGFLANLLLRVEAAPAVLANLGPEEVADWPLRGVNPATDHGLVLLEQARRVCPGPAELEADYRQLFVGPGTMSAPPWESVHLSDEGLTFQSETLGVRAAYAEFGLQAPALHKEPDDHIGLELAFVGQLAVAALRSSEAGDVGAESAVVAALGRFVHQHLLRWAPEFARLVTSSARTPLYAAVGHLLIGAVDWMGQHLPAET